MQAGDVKGHLGRCKGTDALFIDNGFAVFIPGDLRLVHCLILANQEPAVYRIDPFQITQIDGVRVRLMVVLVSDLLFDRPYARGRCVVRQNDQRAIHCCIVFQCNIERGFLGSLIHQAILSRLLCRDNLPPLCIVCRVRSAEGQCNTFRDIGTGRHQHGGSCRLQLNHIVFIVAVRDQTPVLCFAIEIPPQVDDRACTGIVAVGFHAAAVQHGLDLIVRFCVPGRLLRFITRMEVIGNIRPSFRNRFGLRINLRKEVIHIDVVCLEFLAGIDRAAHAIPRAVVRFGHCIEPDRRACCEVLFPVRNRVAVRPKVLRLCRGINRIKFLFQFRDRIHAEQMDGVAKLVNQYGFIFIAGIMIRRILPQETEDICIIDAGNRIANHPAVTFYIIHIRIIRRPMLRNAIGAFSLAIYSQLCTILNHLLRNIRAFGKHDIYHVRRSLQRGRLHCIAGLHGDAAIRLDKLRIERSHFDCIDLFGIRSFIQFVRHIANHLNGDLCVFCRNLFQLQSGHLIEIQRSVAGIVAIVVELCFLSIHHDLETGLFIGARHVLIPIQFDQAVRDQLRLSDGRNFFLHLVLRDIVDCCAAGLCQRNRQCIVFRDDLDFLYDAAVDRFLIDH